MSKRIDVLFCASFIAMIVLPLVLVSTDPGGNTKYENRALAKWPSFHDEQGNFSSDFLPGFENWFSDHIGLRNSIIKRDALIQYYVFRTLKVMQPFTIVLGPHGELAGIPNLDDYQHRNLFTEKELRTFDKTLTTIRDYLATKDCKFYYMQCYDKHSIYPEQYPESIIQFGNVSKADQLVNTITDHTDINIVRIKQALLHGKKSYNLYGNWTDPWHWNPRAAFIAYGELIKAINRDHLGKYKVLVENDFSIEIKDAGMTYFDTIHRKEMIEVFTVKNPQAVSAIERIAPETHFMVEAPDVAHYSALYINENVNNNETLLILGDSYIRSSITFNALSESFYRTIFFNFGHLQDDRFLRLIEVYNPQIVVFEAAERSISGMSILHSVACTIAKIEQ